MIIKKIDEKIKNLSKISSMTFELISILSDEKHSRNDVVKIVECDSVLTAQILKAVNSAQAGIRREVTSINQAIAYIGEQSVGAIAIGLGLSILKNPLTGYEAAKNTLWAHDLKTAIAARIIAQRINAPVNHSTIYTAGLLHDIGKIVISDFLDFNNKPLDTDRTFLDYERDQTGTTHCEVGKKMAISWKLPPLLIEAIEHHHCPSHADESFKTAIYIIHLADFISMQTGDGTGIDSLLYNIDNSWADHVSIDRNEICHIILKTISEYEKIKNSFNEVH